MNFKDFYVLLDSVTQPLNPQLNPLDDDEVAETIQKVAENTFGHLPNTIIKRFNTIVVVHSPTREIGFSVLPTSAYRPEQLVDIDFGWQRSAEPDLTNNMSPKDNTIFAVGQQVHPETIPLLTAFKEFLTALRNYPILLTYSPVRSPGSSRKERRASLYERVLKAVGYILKGSGSGIPVWKPPFLNH